MSHADVICVICVDISIHVCCVRGLSADLLALGTLPSRIPAFQAGVCPASINQRATRILIGSSDP